MGHILIFNRRPEEREFLFQACRAEGLVYTALDREKALHLLDTVRFSVALVDVGLAGTEGLARALERVPCLVLTGRDEERLSEAVRDWPAEGYVDYILVSQRPIDQIRCRKVLATAEEYARLKSDLTSVARSRDSAERKLKDVAEEIRTLNQALTGGLARELERRSRLEERYVSFQKLTRKFEDILRKLYAANDVSNLLEIVGDVKDLLRAGGISIYILEENETLGRYLKPLVWDDAFLLHADFARFVAGVPSPDFAASAAETCETIVLTDPASDPRYSPRYREALKAPLRSLLCTPLRHDLGTIGVIEVYNKTVGGRLRLEAFDRRKL